MVVRKAGTIEKGLTVVVICTKSTHEYFINLILLTEIGVNWSQSNVDVWMHSVSELVNGLRPYLISSSSQT